MFRHNRYRGTVGRKRSDAARGRRGRRSEKGGELNLEWESSHTGKEEVEGVHLSRLRTDTPTIHQKRQTHQNQQTHQTNKKGGGEFKKKKSTSAPVTSMDRHTSTGKDPKQRKKERNRPKTRREKREYKCTCHVYGQTHQYGGDDRENKPKGVTMETQCSEGRRRSTSAPVTSMDRHTRTKSWQRVFEARTSRRNVK